MGNRVSRRSVKRNDSPKIPYRMDFERKPPYIPKDEVKNIEAFPRGTGGLGDVWKCFWCRPSGTRKVAVKSVRIPQGNDELLVNRARKKIRLDSYVWVTLAHDNILILHGITEGFGLLPALVSPWTENGSLDTYLNQGHILSKANKLRMLRQIAAGLDYLHGRGVVHGDLTSTNVLINDDVKLCLAYFGLSMILIEAQNSPFDDCHPGHVRWMAPEMLAIPEQGGVVMPTKAADVYSYGCIMLQLLCEHVPYRWLMQPFHVIVARVSRIEPFRQVTGVKEAHKEYSLKCLSVNPKDRPMAFEIVEFFE
ncbi:kinase-like domain-containing protein [Suillus subalutaceus]|uniref:kinase-like domain-containing protein n=1 Tax=Suillus subalutaceus TaxID=48586 RepID=UPI001B86C5EF|nr:kinase-like domain-containing protein [Suillus subalutaceus]KAG1844921.1 kinase-like domain-containing protein [Suillus subalutaceus]